MCLSSCVVGTERRTGAAETGRGGLWNFEELHAPSVRVPLGRAPGELDRALVARLCLGVPVGSSLQVGQGRPVEGVAVELLVARDGDELAAAFLYSVTLGHGE